MGRIKKKKNNYTVEKKNKKFYHTGSVYKNPMERYFALKISSLIFRRPKNSARKVS